MNLGEFEVFGPAILVGVLFFLFRSAERWLHQHIFKVGWLLTRNHQITTILYYIVFLPGALLHEAVCWLAAGVLNVRANRSIKLPQQTEIGRLELNFIQIAPGEHPVKRAVIAGSPPVAGLLALWVIAMNAFALDTVLSIAAPGQLDDVARAVSALTAQADFWLWFYVAFTIANTMLPTMPAKLRGWRQIGAAALPVIIIGLALGISQTFAAEAGETIGQLLNSLALILSLTTLINILMIIVLGTVEAVIEGLTGHSAAFQDGRMIAMTRQQALERKEAERQQRQSARSAPARKNAAAATSIYMLKLPIPGPPGQEPISRSVVTVLDAPGSKQEPAVREKDKRTASMPPSVIPPRMDLPTPRQMAKPASNIAPFSKQKPRQQPEVKSGETPPPLDAAGQTSRESARFTPFSRPFVKPATDITAADDRDEAGDSPPASREAPFMRPFADQSIDQGNAPPAKRMSESKPGPATASGRQQMGKDRSKSMLAFSKTRPAPKPARQADRNANREQGDSGHTEDQELKYEPIDDEYIEEDGSFYDDAL